MATNLAPSSLLNVTPATAPTIRMCQHDLTASNTTCLGTVPHITAEHNAGHIHCALPVRGLPPEYQHKKDEAGNKHNNHVHEYNDITEEWFVLQGMI